MFFEESEISDHFICPYCKNKSNDPRLVECGASFCMPCINSLTKEDQNVFSCPACDQDHLIPAKSSSKNVNLTKKSEKKSEPSNARSTSQQFKSPLGELKQNSDQLALELQSRANKISGLRSELNISSHQLFESIKQHNSEINAQIDENELSLSPIGDIGDEYKTQLENFLKETLEFHWSSSCMGAGWRLLNTIQSGLSWLDTILTAIRSRLA